jgi:hypothetical protein
VARPKNMGIVVAWFAFIAPTGMGLIALVDAMHWSVRLVLALAFLALTASVFFGSSTFQNRLVGFSLRYGNKFRNPHSDFH